jgi:hypothetical protein
VAKQAGSVGRELQRQVIGNQAIAGPAGQRGERMLTHQGVQDLDAVLGEMSRQVHAPASDQGGGIFPAFVNDVGAADQQRVERADLGWSLLA